jgi:hypothetical protein
MAKSHLTLIYFSAVSLGVGSLAATIFYLQIHFHEFFFNEHIITMKGIIHSYLFLLCYQRRRPESAVISGKAKSSANINNSAVTGSVSLSSLTSEEIRVLRRAKEEYARRGGWVRIFPSVNSWEMYR